MEFAPVSIPFTPYFLPQFAANPSSDGVPPVSRQTNLPCLVIFAGNRSPPGGPEGVI